MKDLWAQHRTFCIVAGGMLLASLVLLLGVVVPARSSAAEALAEADKLQKIVKASEGNALSSSSRQSLEAEVEALKARSADLERVMNPPKIAGGTDPVMAYGSKVADLNRELAKASAQYSIQVPEKTGFSPEVPAEEVAELLPSIELAQRILKAVIAAGARRIDSVSPATTSEFFSEEMALAPPVKRTVVVFEIRGPVDSMMKLLHSLQQKETLYILPRARLTREKPDSPEATLRFAVGSVEVSESKAKEEDAGGDYIFER